MTQRPCGVSGCDKPYRCSGYCAVHYNHFRIYGDPNVRFKAAQGSGHFHCGYRRVTVNGRRMFEHVAVWEKANGPVPTGHAIHHVNHNKLDNRLENLACIPWGEHTRIHHKGIPNGPRSEATKAKISASSKGHRHTDESRAKMRAAQQKRAADISAELKRQWASGVRRRLVR